MLKCKDCKSFISNQDMNNCREKIFIKVYAEDSACYKIQNKEANHIK